MEAFSALLAICAGNSPVTGEFTAQMPVTRSFDIFFDLRLNKRLSKQSWGWLFETPLGSLWRHSDGFKCVYCKITCGSSDVMQQGEPSHWHYNDVIMSAIASQINGVPIVCSTVCSSAVQSKHQSSASLTFVKGIHWWPVDYPNKVPETGKCFHLMASSCDYIQWNEFVPWAVINMRQAAGLFG